MPVVPVSGAVCPIRGGDGGHAVADARAVLADYHTVTARDPGVAIGHVRRALLMNHRNQADARGCENVHGVHEGGAHDAEHVGHAVGDQGFHKRLGWRHFLNTADDGALVDGGFAHGALLRLRPAVGVT